MSGRPDSSHGGAAASDPLITLAEVTLARAHGVVIEDVTLTITAGVTSLIGPNGSGKSTLLHAIAGLLAPVRGTVSVLGQPPSQQRRHIAYVLQAQHSPAHIPVTVREIVALGRVGPLGLLRRAKVRDRVAIDAAIDAMELSHLAGRHMNELSGGQRQRAFVAQGLAQGAQVLLLDEPLAGLDLASADRIRQVLLSESQQGRAVVVATHDLTEAARGDRVVLVGAGGAVDGPPGEVLTAKNLQRAYGNRLLRLDSGSLLLDDGAHHHHDPDHHSHEAEPPTY